MPPPLEEDFSAWETLLCHNVILLSWNALSFCFRGGEEIRHCNKNKDNSMISLLSQGLWYWKVGNFKCGRGLYSLPMQRHTKWQLGTGETSSVGKRTCCWSLKTWVQISSIHIQSSIVVHAYKPRIVREETGVSLESVGPQLSSRFNERSCLQRRRWRERESRTPNISPWPEYTKANMPLHLPTPRNE